MILRYLYMPLFARCLFSLMQLLLSPLIIFLPIRKIFNISNTPPLFEIRLLSVRTDWTTSFITGGKFAAPPPLQAIGNYFLVAAGLISHYRQSTPPPSSKAAVLLQYLQYLQYLQIFSPSKKLGLIGRL